MSKETKQYFRMARICRFFEFAASHTLPGVPPGHKCGQMHGHNYKVEIEIRGEYNTHHAYGNGMVEDFGQIDERMKPILDQLDHNHLNVVMQEPTAENIAAWILDNYPLGNIWRVRVWETDRCWAEVVNEQGQWPINHRA